MKLCPFKRVDGIQQVQGTWDNGILIGLGEEGERQAILYRIEKLCVKIQRYTRQNEIDWIKSFISDELRTPYLDRIDWGDLLGSS